MVKSTEKAVEISKEMEAAYKTYSKAAGDIILNLSRIAGLSEETAMKFATSERIIDIVALNLYSLTSQALFILNAETDKANEGGNNADL